MKRSVVAPVLFGGIDDLNNTIVRAVAPLATAATVVLIAVAFMASDEGFLIQAAGGVVVAGLAWVQVWTQREDAVIVLSAAALTIITTTALVDVPGATGTASAALAMIGIAASLFVHRRAGWFLAGYAMLLLFANFVWYRDALSAIAAGAITVVVFIFGALVFLMLRNQLEVQAERYRHLFARAPVSIWEEDFSRAGTWIESLRAAGVDDLEEYFVHNPEMLRYAAGLIEVVNVNAAAVDLMEADSPVDIIGPIRSDVLSDAALQSFVPQLLAVWDSEDHAVIEVHGAKTLRGSRLEGLLSWTALRRVSGLDLSTIIVAIVDVTDSRIANEQLQALLQSRDDLVATVSHELRTPLTAVVGLSAELHESFDKFSQAETLEFVRLIASQSGEVATIVDDLLAAARAETGSLTVKIESVDIAEETAATVAGIGLGDAIPTDVRPGIGPVTGDPGRIRQIIRNLLVNAGKYGGPERRVVLKPDGWMARIEVRDSGEPLPEDEQEAIFERYYRARQTPGMTASIGLGLAVSRELARMMGGDLTYHHDGETVFTVELPMTTVTGDRSMKTQLDAPRADSPNDDVASKAISPG